MNTKWKKITYVKVIAVIVFLIIFSVGIFIGQRYESSRSSTPAGWKSPTSSVISSVGFFCYGGKSIHAVFMTNGVEISLSDGRTMNLSQTVAADGGRYANNDESFVFWTKGDGAFVNENGTTTYASCIVAK